MGGDSSTPFDMSSGLMQGAAGAIQNPGEAAIGQMNPFIDNVIGRTTQNMNDNATLQRQGIGDAAQAADAFGGGRHGVVEGTMMGDTNQAIGDMSAGMMNQGYNSAVDNVYRSAGMAGDLGQNYYNIGNNLMDRQQAQGDRAHEVNQGVMDQAQGIYQGNDISNIWNQIQGGLQGNPLMGAGSQKGSSQLHPSTMSQIGAGVGMVSDLMGAGK